MDDLTNVRLIDPHAKGASGDDHIHPIVEKRLQCLGAPGLGETGVVWRRAMPGAGQRPSHRFGEPTCRSVDDDHVIIARKQIEEGPKAIAFGSDLHDTEPEIRAIERAKMHGESPGPKAQYARDVGSDCRRCAAGESHARRTAQLVSRGAQRSVTRPKVVAPLGDTMRLVNGKQGRPDSSRGELRREGTEPFRRDVEQAERSGPRGVPDFVAFGRFQGTVHTRGWYSAGPRGCDLILHEGNEWRDDDGETATDQRRYLKADRLAAAGGKNGKGISAREDRSNHGCLRRAKVGIAEMIVEQAASFDHRIGHGHESRRRTRRRVTQRMREGALRRGARSKGRRDERGGLELRRAVATNVRRAGRLL